MLHRCSDKRKSASDSKFLGTQNEYAFTDACALYSCLPGMKFPTRSCWASKKVHLWRCRRAPVTGYVEGDNIIGRTKQRADLAVPVRQVEPQRVDQEDGALGLAPILGPCTDPVQRRFPRCRPLGVAGRRHARLELMSCPSLKWQPCLRYVLSLCEARSCDCQVGCVNCGVARHTEEEPDLCFTVYFYKKEHPI